VARSGVSAPGRPSDPELHPLLGLLNVCPVYERTGGHAYGSTYPGPIGAITPVLVGPGTAGSLPYASSLCGACYEVCPVKINIPEVLVHLRHREVEHKRRADPERLTMEALARVFSDGGARRPRSARAVSGSVRWFAAARSAACPGRSRAGRRRAT
jgi:L-lactate utilization protein LutB